MEHGQRPREANPLLHAVRFDRTPPQTRNARRVVHRALTRKLVTYSKVARMLQNGKPAAADVEAISLIDTLDQEWLKLPLAVMRDVGPAVQTLAGLLKISKKATFVRMSTIAASARVPLSTARKQMTTLQARGWVENAGRGRTRAGRPRRTVTLSLTQKAIDATEIYGVLPWWACCRVRNFGPLAWSTKAVLSIIMARLMGMKAAIEQQDGHGALHADDIPLSLLEMTGSRRWQFSLSRLEWETGLSRHSIIAAKRRLYKSGMIRWAGGTGDWGTISDVLEPNLEFRVLVTPASSGKIFVDF